ncbi:hypothetical protein AA0473_0176 [Acetobacter orleanensis NRIC 0473]|nr:hypothetical protein AA0473_0176 [Acetobacter orleanensis NRIC 0473]
MSVLQQEQGFQTQRAAHPQAEQGAGLWVAQRERQDCLIYPVFLKGAAPWCCASPAARPLLPDAEAALRDPAPLYAATRESEMSHIPDKVRKSFISMADPGMIEKDG